MIQVTLYRRNDCNLCEQTQVELSALQQQYPHKLTVIDVDRNPDLQRSYVGQEVPIVEVGPYRLRAPFSPQELQMTLGAAQDRVRDMDALEESVVRQNSSLSMTWTASDRFTHWLSRHYLALFNLFVFIYISLPFLAPVLMASGVEAPARLIYRGYGMLCHQLAYRSVFLFGEQVFYPREAAGVDGLVSYAQATGLSEGNSTEDLLTARGYYGDERIGYKVALCARDVAIYGGILLFGLLYPLTGRRLPPLPLVLWIAIGLVPIGVDGVSQLLSQPPFEFITYRESSPFLRTLTGFLFGFSTAWFGYPMVEQTMSETRQVMANKLRRINRTQNSG